MEPLMEGGREGQKGIEREHPNDTEAKGGTILQRKE